MKYKVGDKVKVRSWKSMAEEFVVDDYGDINTPGDSFTKAMKKYCGKTLTITYVGMSFYLTEGNAWNWSDAMFDSNCNTVVIYTNDNKVIALDKATGKTGVAICHPEDTFDFFTGADLAFERLRGRANPPRERGPKYYSGEIVCIESWPRAGGCNFTVGKIYKVKNGKFTDDNGEVHGNRRPFINFKDLSAHYYSKFVEVVR